MQSIPGPRVPAGCHSAPIIPNETPARLPDPNVLPRWATLRRPDPGGGAVLSPGGVALRRPLPAGGGCPSVGRGLGQFLSGGGCPSLGPDGGVLLSLCLSGGG